MDLLIQAAGSWNISGNADMIFGVITRMVFVMCAVLAVWKLLVLVLSAPTYEERHFWDHKRRPR